MIQSNVFDYVRILDKAADASWMRNDAIAKNIANVDTPGYKRQDVEFESVLKKAMRSNCFASTDARVASAANKRLDAHLFTDYETYSYRLDGNNVDIDNENVMLAENQLKYHGLMAGITQEFKNLQTVIK